MNQDFEEDDCEEDDCEEISRQTFINIGMQCAAMCDDPHAIMTDVFAELISLHACRLLKSVKIEACKASIKPKIRSIDSELFSLCSDSTDDTVFKYYISSSDEDDFDYDNSELI